MDGTRIPVSGSIRTRVERVVERKEKDCIRKETAVSEKSTGHSYFLQFKDQKLCMELHQIYRWYVSNRKYRRCKEMKKGLVECYGVYLLEYICC